MSYGLGIDLGTSFTVATIRRTDGADAVVETVPLGRSMPAVSSVLHLGEDGSLLVGAAAEERVLTEPDRVFRGFVRRVGEVSPLDGWLRPEALTAWLTQWVIDVVVAQEGAPPDRIALTHPPGWGLRERQLAEDALLESGIDDVVFVSAPLAAATGWLAAEELEPADTVAVLDLGGMVDATVLARTETGDFAQLGAPRTLDHAGGAAFDEMVFTHVLDVLGDRVAAADLDDPAMLEGMARLLEACGVARKELSDSAAVAVPVTLPGVDTSVELTRSELEAMIRPGLLDGVDALREVVADAGLTVPELDVVLVTGGVSATPLVTRLLADELGRPVILPRDPLEAAAVGAAVSASAVGAAVAASDQREDLSSATTMPLPLVTAMMPEPVDAQFTELPGSFSPPTASPVGLPARRQPRQRALLAAAAGVIAVAAAVIPLTIIQPSSSTVPSVPKAEDGGASEDVGRRTLDTPDAASNGDTRTGTATVGGTGVDARGKPQVVPTGVPVPTGTGRAAPLPVVPAKPRPVPAPVGPENPPPPPLAPIPRPPTPTPAPAIPPSPSPSPSPSPNPLPSPSPSPSPKPSPSPSPKPSPSPSPSPSPDPSPSKPSE